MNRNLEPQKPLSDELAAWESNLETVFSERDYVPGEKYVSLRLEITEEETGVTGEALREFFFRRLKKVFEQSLSPQILEVTSLGGACPTQAEGYIWGKPFYFRARHGEWSLAVAETNADAVSASSIDFSRGVYFVTEGEDDSGGWMEGEAVLKLLWAAMKTREDYPNWRLKR